MEADDNSNAEQPDEPTTSEASRPPQRDTHLQQPKPVQHPGQPTQNIVPGQNTTQVPAVTNAPQQQEDTGIPQQTNMPQTTKAGPSILKVLVWISLGFLGLMFSAGVVVGILSQDNDESTKTSTEIQYETYETKNQIAPLQIEYPTSLTFEEESTSDPSVVFLYGDNRVPSCGDNDSRTINNTVSVNVVNVTHNSDGQIDNMSEYQALLTDGGLTVEEDGNGLSVNGFGPDGSCLSNDLGTIEQYQIKIHLAVFPATSGDIYIVGAAIPNPDEASLDTEMQNIITDMRDRIIMQNDIF